MKKSTIYASPIMMTQEYWEDSQFSVVRYTGTMRFNGVDYIICNKEGKDIYELSGIAEKEGRAKAIEPGEPADLVICDWLPIYRAVGRDRFIEIVKNTNDLAEAQRLADIAPKMKGGVK